MRRTGIFALVSAMGLAVPVFGIGGMQLVFEQDGRICGAFVNRTTYYQPWNVDSTRRFPSGAGNGLSSLDGFTVRGNGVLRMPNGGRYRVKIIADDALTVNLGGQTAVAQTAYSSGREFMSEVYELEAGRAYPISFVFRENVGNELCQIRLLNEDTSETIWISSAHLEAVPEPWTFFEHGRQTAHGGVEYDHLAREFTVTGSGRGFVDAGDEAVLLTTESEGEDFAILATATVPERGAAALVARASLADDSCRSVSLSVRKDGVRFEVRGASGAVSVTSVADGLAAGSKVHMRLSRVNGTFYAQYLPPNGKWMSCGSAAAGEGLAGDVQAGFGVYSGSLAETASAKFSDVSLFPVSVEPRLDVSQDDSGIVRCRVRVDTAAEARMDAALALGEDSWWWTDDYSSPVVAWRFGVTERSPDGVEARTASATSDTTGSVAVYAWRGEPSADLSVTASVSTYMSFGSAPCPVALSAGLSGVEATLSGNGLYQAVYKSWQAGPSSATPDFTLVGTVPANWSVSDGPYSTDAGDAVANQNFYSVWEGALSVPKTGYYRFRQSYENGCAKMSLAGQDVFAAFDRVTGSRADESGWMHLAAGARHPISLLWRKGNGSATGSFSFQVERHGGGGYAGVPREWLSTTRGADDPVRLDAEGLFGTWRDYDIGTTIPGNSIVEGTLSSGGYSPDSFNLVFMSSTEEGAFDNARTSDGMHFFGRPMEGDFLVEANVSIPTGYNDGRGVWRRSGLCVREDPSDPSAREITAVRSFADGRLMAQMRSAAGGRLSTFHSVNLGERTARVGLQRVKDVLSLYLDGRRVATRPMYGWPSTLYVGFAGSSWAKEHQSVAFFQNCIVKRQRERGFSVVIGEPSPEPLGFSIMDFSPVYKATMTTNDDGSVHLLMPSAEWNSGLAYRSEEGLDLSGGRYLGLDVENLSSTRQMRLTMHVAAGGVVTDSVDHASAVQAENRSVNTGIALNPGEKGTMLLHLPHASIYHYPEGAKGVYSIDTRHVTEIALKMQWPYEQEFRYLADCRLSNLRLVKFPDAARRVDPADYLPFVDRYGQFVHSTWPEKVTSDGQLVEDLAKERAALKPPPQSWDEYGGWKDGPTLAATGHFRTEKVDGKWWLVTPTGRLFFSFGVNVARTMTDATYGPTHRDWYTADVNRNGNMSYTIWNLRKKFGTSDYEAPYYGFLLDRFDSWGINTIGNWSAGALYSGGRKPYVCTLYSRGSGLPTLQGYAWYDCCAPDFASALASAVAASAQADSVLTKALTDPMCIGFFIDNEPPIEVAASASGYDSAAFFRAYFGACRAAVKMIAPNKLYLGCRLVGYRHSSALLSAIGEFCDVASFNGYSNSIYNVPTGVLSGAGFDRPIMHTEFHFGCLDRGMFSAGLCPAGTQQERARLLRRFVEGALAHPCFVGCHWFQYRDQPLQGRGDGEAYEIGLVDVCDRPYPQLVRAARTVAETMYARRAYGVW